MGSLEDSIRGKVRRTKINSAIITALAVAGILAIAAVAPNTLQLLGKPRALRQNKQRISSSLKRMVRQGYVKFEDGKKGRRLRLTAKGEKFAAMLGHGRLAPKKPRRWDGKWRVLIFDIPEKQKRSREQIRRTLVSLGFRRLQDSVWVYPYDCEDLIILLKADLRIGKDLLYLIVERIEYDKPLRDFFSLR